MEQVEAVRRALAQELSSVKTTEELRDLQRRFIGASGSIQALTKEIAKQADPEAKRSFGRAVNELKSQAETWIQEKSVEVLAAERLVQFHREAIDVTMPGRPPRLGLEHVVQQTANKIKRVLGGLGFEYVEGPELEQFKYNFDALNYPPDHPAMDDQDTFYVTDDLVLRTQCTALQGRTFERRSPPLRIVTIGRTYRNEAVDRTHNHTFHQVDCFMVDEGVSMATLKGTLGLFARAMFGPDVKIRFRPDFFPFVEPGVDYAIATPKLFGGRWVELGGAGMIHPNILRRYGFDTERYSGFAFGLGVERIPMMAYGIDDLRVFLDNDLRFLRQFPSEPLIDQAVGSGVGQ